MRLAPHVAVAIALASPAARAVTDSLTPATQTVLTGETATVSAKVERISPLGGGLKILVPQVPTLTLTVVHDTSSMGSVDCSKSAGGTIGIYTITCSGGGMSAVVQDNVDAVGLDLTFVTSTAGMPTVAMSATCTSDCGPTGLPASAQIVVQDYPLGLTHTAESATVPAGSVGAFDVVLQNGPLAASAIDLAEQVPAGTSLKAVSFGGTDFVPGATWAGGGGGEAQLNGAMLEVRPTGGTLAAAGRFAYTVKLQLTTAKPGDVVSATVTANASAPPAIVKPVSQLASFTVGASNQATFTIQKSADKQHARLGDPVSFAITARPSNGPFPDGAQIGDALDQSLSLAALRVAVGGAPAQTATCDGMARAIGPLQVQCPRPGPGGTIVATVAPGANLASQVQLSLDCVVRPTAPAAIDNVARITDAMGGPLASATAHLAIDNAGAGYGNVIVSLDRSVATRGDLVPVRIAVGAPGALGQPAITLDLGSALRPILNAGGTVEVDPDGGAPFQAPATEAMGKLVIALGGLPPGQVVTAVVRARVGVRAQLGPQPVSAQLADGVMALSSSSATLRVEAEPDFDLATIVGTVYRDEDGDGKRSAGEAGIEGVQVVMEDGTTAITDGDGRYHIAAVVPGQRVVKVAGHTLAPDARPTTDGTRVITVTPGIVAVVDFGVAVPAPSLPAARGEAPPEALPELGLTDAGKLRYQLVGVAAPGARVWIDGRPALVDKHGGYGAQVTLARGRSRFAVVTAYPDGRVVLAARDVYWIERPEGGSLVVPRPAEPRLILRFPASTLADPRFTLEGSAPPTSAHLERLTVAGAPLAPDAAGRLRAHLKLPEDATAGIPLEARFSDGLAFRYAHVIETGGDFTLLVGLAEAKLSYVQSTVPGGASGGHGAQIASVGDGALYAEGRVALYVKGRIQGRYLIEGGLDLDTAQLSDWRELFRGDPTRVFRALDPDRFYTVYGDASQTTAPAQSRGPLFVRVAVDRSMLQFGNIQTGMTGVELGRYARSLTGGRVDIVLAGATPEAPPSTNIIVFGAWLQTARAHDELRGTGGSLYYLSHRTVVEGSALVRVELRDALSERPIENHALAPGDYEVDWIAGRVTLREPLSSIAAAQNLVRSGALDGNRAYLIVDYEYVVVGGVDDGAVGARATQKLWRFRLGGTFASEIHSGYYLFGGDAHVDLGRFGEVVAEFAHSEGRQLDFHRSDDGGLTFADALSPALAPGTVQQGNAWKVEADLHQWGIALRPYVRGIDQGFTDSAHAQDASLLQYGAEATADFFGVHLRLHYDERHFDQAALVAGAPSVDSLHRDAGGDIGRRFGRVELKLGARFEQADDPDPTLAGHRTTIAARIGVDVTRRLTLFAHGQYTVERSGEGPAGRDASLGALGATVKLPWDFSATAEGGYGAQIVGYGPLGSLTLRRDLGAGRLLYGTYTVSQDASDVVSTSLAVGGRQRLGQSRATLFAEDQFRDGRDGLSPTGELKRIHLQSVGADLPLAEKLQLGASFERGQVQGAADDLVRTAGSLHASYAGERLRLQLKGELRNDEHAGGPSLLQWLASGAVTIVAHKDLSFRGKLLWAETSDGTHTREISAGFAWRPSWIDGAALLGRYAYIDDLAPVVQAAAAGAPFAERAHAGSLGGEARLFWRISLGEKVGLKVRDDPAGRLWMILWVNRVSLHVTKRIDAVGEYRWLTQIEPGGSASQQGVAVEANYLLIGHLRIGVGYNFTDFSDDELQLGRGKEHGVFARAQGYY